MGDVARPNDICIQTNFRRILASQGTADPRCSMRWTKWAEWLQQYLGSSSGFQGQILEAFADVSVQQRLMGAADHPTHID